jgi:RNA-directed DNA polymerase
MAQRWSNGGRAMVGNEDRYSARLGGITDLANIYLHYVFDLWVDVWRKKYARGEVVVIRYADDTILGFQHQADADRFLENLRARLRKFGLELHPDKTHLVEFGRYAEQTRERRGEGKPETFDFLGFTHISGKNGKGHYTV